MVKANANPRQREAPRNNNSTNQDDGNCGWRFQNKKRRSYNRATTNRQNDSQGQSQLRRGNIAGRRDAVAGLSTVPRVLDVFVGGCGLIQILAQYPTIVLKMAW